MIKFSQTEDTVMEDMKVPNASYCPLISKRQIIFFLTGIQLYYNNSFEIILLSLFTFLPNIMKINRL